MKKNIKTKTHNLYKIIFLFVVFLGIGYAFLEATLNINGDTTVAQPEFNTYVQSTSVTTGSTSGTPTIIGNDKKEVDFSTALTNDGSSFFEETTTLVNKGSRTSYLTGIDLKVYDSNENEAVIMPIDYNKYYILHGPYPSVTPYEEIEISFGDGSKVELDNILTPNNTISYKLKYNYISGTDMTTVTDYPTYTFKITYNYSVQPICEANDNITTLSNTACSGNEQVTPAAGIVCKRAINLHQEECTQTSTSSYCSYDGYTPTGSKGTSTITYGNCGTQGSSIASGDAFTCDVNGDGVFDELSERFYYVSDYFNTTSKSFESDTAVLIYYNNVTSGISCNHYDRYSYAYSSPQDNYAIDPNPVNQGYSGLHGPITAIKGLPKTNQWSNVSLKNTSRAILSEYGSVHDSSVVVDGTTYNLPTDFSYSGRSARLLTAREVMTSCGLNEISASTTPINTDICGYLFENTSYSRNVSIPYSEYWFETLDYDSYAYAYVIAPFNNTIRSSAFVYNGQASVRPVIEVPKSKISY